MALQRILQILKSGYAPENFAKWKKRSKWIIDMHGIIGHMTTTEDGRKWVQKPRGRTSLVAAFVSNFTKVPVEPVSAPLYSSLRIACWFPPAIVSAVPPLLLGFTLWFLMLSLILLQCSQWWWGVCTCVWNVPPLAPVLYVYTHHPWNPRDLVMWGNQMPRLRDDAGQCASLFSIIFGDMIHPGPILTCCWGSCFVQTSRIT